MLRLGVHLVAAGDGADFYAAIFRGVAGDEFVERVLYRDFFVAERGGELLNGGRFVGGVDDGLAGCFAFVVGHGSRRPVYSAQSSVQSEERSRAKARHYIRKKNRSEDRPLRKQK